MLTFRQPFRGSYPVSQKYGEVIFGVTYQNKPHTGIDYLCPEGTEILASADGEVMTASQDAEYGKTVIIKHSAQKATLYAHLSQIRVTPRQNVKQGDVIGLSGNTGNSTGPHLHFEARRSWYLSSTHFDPMDLPLMSFADPVIEQKDGPAAEIRPLEPGIYRVACEAAYVRGWETLSRGKLVYRGERVYVFGEYKLYAELKFYYIGADNCMAAIDNEGTVILEKADGKED